MSAAPEITNRRNVLLNAEGSYELAPGHQLPGWTVDALLGQGKVAEAQAELERLVVEGADSGDAIEMTPERWDDLRAIARGDRDAAR